MSTDQSSSPGSYGFPLSSLLPANGASPGGSRSDSLGDTVRRAIQAVVPGFGSTPQALADSLKRSFQIRPRPDGRKVVSWMPASIGGSTTAANLTGALAEFYARASSTLSQARLELDKLEPLCRADSSDCCDDIRGIVKLKLGEIEDALKSSGGPCEQWVEDVFTALLGDEEDGEDGLVGRLVEQFTESDDDAADLGNATLCEPEERRRARISLFRGRLAGLREEWVSFKAEFLSDWGSLTLLSARLRARLHIIAQATASVRRGLCAAGYSEADLKVEEFSERTAGTLETDVVPVKLSAKSPTSAKLGGNDGPVADAATGSLHVGSALTRIEQFALRTAPEILQRPSESGLISLAVDARVLLELSRLLRLWLLSKLDAIKEEQSELDGLLGGQKVAALIERTGDISLVLYGTHSAARALRDQLHAFATDLTAYSQVAAPARA